MRRILALAGIAAIAVVGLPPLATAAPILNPGNGHYYEFIDTGTHPTGSLLWEDARDLAAGTTYLGMTGFLATLGSQAESAWFESQFSGLSGWLGGAVTAGTVEGTRTWGWVVGPEQFDFWQETGVNGVGTCLQGAYCDWANGEPNMFYADQFYLRYVGSAWDDTQNRPGYFVEYVPEPATLLLLGLGLGAVAARRRLKTRA